MKEYELIKSPNTVGVYNLCEIDDERFASVDKWNNIHIWNISKLSHKLITHIQRININDATNRIKRLLMLNYIEQLLLVYIGNDILIIDVNICQVVNTKKTSMQYAH